MIGSSYVAFVCRIIYDRGLGWVPNHDSKTYSRIFNSGKVTGSVMEAVYQGVRADDGPGEFVRKELTFWAIPYARSKRSRRRFRCRSRSLLRRSR